MGRLLGQYQIDISNYFIVISNALRKSLNNIEETKKNYILKKLDDLKESKANPKIIKAKRLHGKAFKNTYSTRIDKYRIGFIIDKKKLVLTFMYASKRADFYEKFERKLI